VSLFFEFLTLEERANTGFMGFKVILIVVEFIEE
jgi:hypothetical protein